MNLKQQILFVYLHVQPNVPTNAGQLFLSKFKDFQYNIKKEAGFQDEMEWTIKGYLWFGRYNKQIKRIVLKMNFSIEIFYDTVEQPVKNEDKTDSPPHSQEGFSIPDNTAKKAKPKKKKIPKENQYNWNETENRRYISFLVRHGEIMILPVEQKKRYKVNVMMSKWIKTRSSTQCHTHHQKMIKKYDSIDTIVKEHAFLLNKPKRECKNIELSIASKDKQAEMFEQKIEDLSLEPLWQMGEPIWNGPFNPQIFFYEEQQICDDNLYFH